MAMSSLAVPESAVSFVVQSGIAPWEDPKPIVDWRWKTVSVFALRLSFIVTLLWAIVASRPPELRRVYRLHVASIPTAASAAQKRSVLTELRTDLPGFRGSSGKILGTHSCAVSELSEPSVVDPDVLTEYRRSVLIEVDAELSSAAEVCELVCGNVSDFGGRGIAQLLDAAKSLAVLRVLELETHAVVQLVGSVNVVGAAIRFLTERHVRQINDVRRISEEIASLRV